MFDGAVVSVPTGKMVVANEMEGELVTAGLKAGAKWTDIDYRNRWFQWTSYFSRW